MSSYVHVDNKGKDVLILDEGSTQGLDHTTLTAEAKYIINFTQLNRRFVLSLHYKRSDSFLSVDATKIYQIKAKDIYCIVLLASIVNASNHTKWVSLRNRKCKIQPTLINLHPNEYSHFTTIHVQLN